ncbi:MAG: serine hydrolase [Aerococcaceae bacterium]|nr:serine hydrolase [Aerococcaceae bacterium]
MGFCPNCGHKFEEGTAFCQECGENVSDLQQPVPVQTRTATVTKKSKTALLVGLASGVLLLSVGGYYVVNGGLPFLSLSSSVQESTRVDSESASTSVSMKTARISENLPSVASVSAQSEAASESAATSSVAVSNQAQHSTVIIKAAEGVTSSTASVIANTSSASETTAAPATNAASETTAAPATNVVTESATPATSTPAETVVAATYDAQRIQGLFNQSMGTVGGRHSLYFQELTNEAGQVVASEPIIIEDTQIRSASVIKLFVLGALYKEAEAGHLDLSREHRLAISDYVGGTGVVQNAPEGTPYTLQQLAEYMIVDSDNMAMNIIVDYVGFDRVNAFIKELGYTNTILQRKMLDTAAIEQGRENYTSAREVGDFMKRLYTKTLVTPSADAQMLAILSRQKDTEKLRYHIPAVGYSKSGQFDTYGIWSDVAIIETPKGAFVLASLSQDGDYSSKFAVTQQLGQLVYEDFINR